MKAYRKEFAIVALITSLFFALGWQTYRLGQARNDYTELVNEFEGYKVAAQAEVQREQQRRIEEVEGVQRNAQKILNGIKTELNLAGSDVERLRQQLRANIYQSNNSSASNECQTERNRIIVLSELLEDCAGKYIDMAGEVDLRRVAGETCEASYNAVANKPKD